jgi:solute carrier family 25 (mitochondrial oxoglutarate transporter), member 11
MDQQKSTNLILASSLASITSSLITHPIDVVKVRVQNKVSNMKTLPFISSVLKNEGPSFLYKGMSASILRNGTFVGSKMVCYNFLKQEFQPQSFASKFACGMSAGAFGAIIGTPFDVVMVSMQSDPKTFSNIPKSIQTIYNQNGWTGYWRGFRYTLSRAVIVTACQFSVYEQLKQELGKRCDHSLIVFGVSSIMSSITTAIVSNPVDLCKTRAINHIPNDTMYKIVKEEGVKALWKGVGPNMMRQVPMNLVRFSCFEFFMKWFC